MSDKYIRVKNQKDSKLLWNMAVQRIWYKMLFQNKTNRKKKQQAKFNVQKKKNGKESIENSSSLCQPYTPTVILNNINLQVDHHTGGRWFIHGSKPHKENQLQSLENYCWWSLVWYKWGPLYIMQSVVPKNARREKHRRELIKCRNSIPNYKHIRHITQANIRYRTTNVRKGQGIIGHPLPHQLIV